MTISLTDKPTIQGLYDQAIKDGKESFYFKGKEILVSYAKYLLEYMEMVTLNQKQKS